ncbi:MAG: DUF1566 domain-containing protein [Peptostreptococcaceae bacterium]|nr:DUF1566 domain-containing protein [Peptostreptococcaceae bacterium]
MLKIKLLLILSVAWVGLFAQSVPNTATFSLFDVLNAVYGSHTSGNLASAFTDSNAAYFDATYGSKTMSPKTMLGFRNYSPAGYPSIGDSYQGGIVAYLFVSGDPGYIAGEYHGIIAAVGDLVAFPNWSSGIYIGSSGTAIGTGITNTNLIVASEGAGTYAARLCYDYSSGIYSDWYLPSNDELEKLYQMYLLGYGNFDYSDGLPPKWWSSTEFNSSNAYVLDFQIHVLSGRSKIAGVRVRPIRYF